MIQKAKFVYLVEQSKYQPELQIVSAARFGDQ